MILLTTQGGFLKPFAWVFGKIFDWLFTLIYTIANQFSSDGDISHVPIIAICVILFTIIVKLIMLPLTIKQQKFSKLSNMMNPELQEIQAKYKDKKDNESMMKMNAETKAVYEKYGTSPTGGCLTMLIQLPIMFAMYRVIYKIPGYVSKVGDACREVISKIGSENLINHFGLKEGASDATIVDSIYNLTSSGWTKLTEAFSNIDIQASADKIIGYNNFFGISLTEAPGWKLTVDGHFNWALLIPILAGLTQWLSSKLMESKSKLKNAKEPEQGTLGNSMKMMNIVMPIMSAVFCVTFPSCIGVYWITSSVVQIIIQIIINRHMDKIDVEKMVQKNIDKVNAKRAMKGLPPKKITNSATSYVEQVKKQEAMEARKGQRDEDIKKSTDYYNTTGKKPGILAAKANMVKMYNEKNSNKKE
ncbi:MAG: YidC/Oxa1 family membrane protein insertase [Butyrivibrio sp.]